MADVNVSDNLHNFSDAIVVGRGVPSVADTMQMGDAVAKTLEPFLNLGDSAANWADAVSKTLLGLQNQAPADTLSMSDGAALFSAGFLQPSDNLRNYLDNVVPLLGLLKELSDTFSMSDAVSINLVVPLTASTSDDMDNWDDGVSTRVAEVSTCFP